MLDLFQLNMINFWNTSKRIHTVIFINEKIIKLPIGTDSLRWRVFKGSKNERYLF